MEMNWYAFFNILVAFLFGALFGFGEILQRYFNMKYNFRVIMSYVYIGLNGIVSIVALLLIKYYKYPNDSVFHFDDINIPILLIAGFSGMMILRSSVFSIKHREKTIEVGLATLFQIFLNRTEARMKNKAAALRFESVKNIMEGVDFSSAVQGLPVLCTSFIDNFSEADTKNLFNAIDEIAKLPVADTEKALLLGRQIALYCDEEILIATIGRYKNSNIENERIARINKLKN